MGVKTYYEILKMALFVAILLTLIFGGIKGYAWIDGQFKLKDEQTKLALEEARQYKEYADNLVRANTEVVNSLKTDIANLERRNSAAINSMLAEIEEKNEKINNMGETIAKLNENIRDLRVASDHAYKSGTGDYDEQYFKKVLYRTKDEDGNELEVPVAWAMFFPNREPDKQWKTGVYPLEYHSRIIQSEQEDGQINTYTEIWFENNKDKASKGIEIPVKITSSEFKQTRNEDSKFYLWAPHINLNSDIAMGSDLEGGVAGGLSFSLSGYGRTKNDLRWRLFDFGVSTNGDDTYAKFTPFAYNLGKHLPLISNTFVGPFFGRSTEGESIFGVGLSVPF